MAEITASKLETSYNDAITADQAIFDEMRTNILLDAGFHYSRRNATYYNKLRDNRHISDNVKLRLTKNHINKIMRIFENNLLTYAPGATIMARDDRNVHERVQADESRAVWEDGKYRSNYNKKRRTAAKDFFIIGEVWVKTLYDPEAGDIIGYEAQVDEAGQTILDANGQSVPDENKPVFEGDIRQEIIKGYDIFIDANATSIDDAAYIGIKKLVNTDELKVQIKNDSNISEERKRTLETAIVADAENSYVAFTGIDSVTTTQKNKTLIKEYWYRPSPIYPMGKYYIAVKAEIIWEGELQTDKYGKPIFPINYALCDEFPSARRGASPIRQGRPCQAEINRTASKIAETQITLGDDKIVTMNGAGLTEGAKLNGIRQVNVEGGGEYKVIVGRTGEQYLNYMNSQITELYNIMGVNEDSAEKPNTNDVVATLYQSLKNKKKFVYYAENFERFLCEWCDTYIKLAKHYFRDDRVIRSVGTCEAVNVAEFKQTDERAYEIRVIPQTDDVESMLGKYLVLTNTLQYGKLDPETLGRVMEEMPFINKGMVSHLTVDYTEARNICLALDRGETPRISKYDKNEKIVETLVRRMREADFEYLCQKNPQIYQNYMRQIDERDQIISQKVEELKAANQGLIPTGGPQIKVDAYVPDPSDPSKTVRATVPQVAFNWFIDRLGKQGAALENIEQSGVQAQIDIKGTPKNVVPIKTTPQG